MTARLEKISLEIFKGKVYCYHFWSMDGAMAQKNLSAMCVVGDLMVAVIAQEAKRQSVLLKVPCVMGDGISDFMPRYVDAFECAMTYIDMEDGYLSSLKQGASDMGIPYGDEMGAFVAWAEKRMGIK